VGGSHSLILGEDGSVWAAGSNSDGQLGFTGSGDKLSFAQVPLPFSTGVKAIAASDNHSLLLTKNGNVYAAGDNSNHQLGTASSGPLNNGFEQVYSGGNVKAISTNTFNTLVLKQDGSVLLTDTAGSFAPVQGLEDKSVTAIAEGAKNSLVRTSTGAVWGEGENSKGQLGFIQNTDRGVFSPVPNMSNVIAVAAGENHSLILTEDGKVWAAGDNAKGQLGTGGSTPQSSTFTPTKDITSGIMSGAIAISAGGSGSLVLKDDGSVWAAGNNNNDQLGSRSATQTSFVKVYPLSGS